MGLVSPGHTPLNAFISGVVHVEQYKQLGRSFLQECLFESDFETSNGNVKFYVIPIIKRQECHVTTLEYRIAPFPCSETLKCDASFDQ